MSPTHLPAAVHEATEALRTVSRRRFLQAASVAAASLSVAPLSLAKAPSYQFMSADDAQVFTRLMTVMFPTQGSKLLPVTQVPVLATLDAALLATMAPHVLQGLKGGVAYFNEAPKAEFGKPFTALSDAQAIQFLDAWGRSDVVPHRALSVGLKKLVSLSYWANPPTWKALGYPGPFTRRNGIPSLGNAPTPQA